jgi:two-component system, chemotaxis family, protein-glutamate methylesterase/glutaminase
MTLPKKLRVLVIDDFAVNRRAVISACEGAEDVEVVGVAEDGAEGMRQVRALRPDVITLDLEMPEVDGFTFLRLLMATMPTPVLVVSSYAHRRDVFTALDLGAFDFVAKGRKSDPEAFARDLLDKLRAAPLLRSPGAARDSRVDGPFVVALGASTGGPPAIQRLVEELGSEQDLALLVAQHMPAGFTDAFARRLDRLGPLKVREAKEPERIEGGTVWIAPGGKHLTLARRNKNLEVRVVPSLPTDKHAPSVDVLFRSVAEVLGARALAIVLTGMGSDGKEGVRAVHVAGGEVWAESQDSAVVFGMPSEAIATGVVRRVLPLVEVSAAIRSRARRL